MKKLNGISILVAEDEADLRDVFVDHFLYLGAKVEGVSSGKQGWDLIKKQNFDIVFSDIRMPGGDGIELIKNIHHMNSPKPNVFLCTGFSDLSASEAKNYGVLEIFSKPFDMNQVVTQMQILHEASRSTKVT